MKKLTESTKSGEVVLQVLDQKSFRSLQMESLKKQSYSKWLKAGFVFAATTGAFVLTRATGGLSWMSSWFGDDKESISENEVSGLTTRVSANGVELSNAKDIHGRGNNINAGVLEGFDVIGEDFMDEGEDFEELELLDGEEDLNNFDSVRSSGRRKLLSFSSGLIELSSLNGTNGFKINGEVANDYSGVSVSGIGDINGDGFDDLIIGAEKSSPNGEFSGRSYVIFGRSGSLTSELELLNLNGTNGFKINGEAAYDYSGRSVSGVGDINGDGIDDLIIGAEGADPNGDYTYLGRSYVIFGRTASFPSELELSNLNGTNGFKIDGEAANDYSGNSVSVAGDINGDGFDDLIIGAKEADSNGAASGRSYVIFGKNTSFTSELDLSSLDGTNGFKINGEVKADESGGSVSVAGDINGDGFDDLIIGAKEADPNGGASGRSYVIFGKNSSFTSVLELSALNGTNGFKINGEANGDNSGCSVSSAGDINGDGFDDVIIGANEADPNGINSGRSYVIFGKSGSFPSELELSNLNGTNGFKINGEAGSDNSGYSVSSAGDINGDGFDDVIIGANEADPNGEASSGRSYVIFGKSGSFPSEIELSNLNGTNGFKINGEVNGDQSGCSVRLAGDINGDGVNDLIIGANLADPNGGASGRTYVIFGKSVTNSPSVISSSTNSLNYIEGDGSVVINGDIEISDVDDANLSNATVSITSGFVSGEDILEFKDQSGIVGSYSGSTGVLTLTGDATIAEYQTALQSISYNNTEENPSEVQRTVSFAVNDGELDSLAFTTTINVTAVNDLPVLSSTTTSISYTEGDGAVVVNGGIEISDVDSTNISNATVSITSGFVSGEDILEFSNQSGITGSYSSSTGVLTLSGDATIAEYQTALQSIRYNNTAENPSEVQRTVSFAVNDGESNSLSFTSDIDVTGVNDIPVLSSSTSSLSYTEGDGSLVINGDIEISDVDDINLSNATVSITSGFVSGEDVLEFSDQSDITGSYSSSTGVLTLSGDATIAEYQTALQSIRYNNTAENPSEVQRTVSFAVNDGESNSLSFTSDIDVTAVNDASVLSSVTTSISYTEGDGAIIVNEDIEVNDVDSANISNATVSITSGFTSGEDILEFKDQSGIVGSYSGSTGVLKLSGDATISEYQTALQSIRYNNTEENPSEVQRTVSFAVNDGELDSLVFTTTINVTGVNDIPVLSSSTSSLSYTEGDGAVVINGDIEISDVDDVNLSNATVSVTSVFVSGEDILEFKDQSGIVGSYSSSTGLLTLSGEATIAEYQTALQSIRYNNTAENPSEVQRTISLMVNDGESNSLSLTTTLNVTAVNDVPVLSSTTTSLSYTEGDGAIVINEDIEVSDVDDVNLSNATVSITSGFVSGEDILEFKDQIGITGSYLNDTGILTLTGDATIGDYQIALRSIRYNNPEENPSEVQRTISFMVNDGEANSLPLATTLNVTGVNDISVLSSSTSILSYTEGDGAVVINGDIEISDVDDVSLSNATVSITSGFVSGEDILEFKDQSGITGSYLNDTGILTLTGNATISEYQTALRSVRYNNTEEKPSEIQRITSFMVNDGESDSLSFTMNINVAVVNSSLPVLSSSTNSLSYTEGDGSVVVNGNILISDVDSPNLSNATVVLVSGFMDGEDVLEFKDQSGITGSYDNSTGVLALTGTATLSAYQTVLRDVRYNNTEVNPSELQRTISFMVNDGDSNSLDFRMSINVFAVNSLPVLSSAMNILSYTKGDGAVPINGFIEISDVDDVNMSGGTVSITSGFFQGEDILGFIDQSGISGLYSSSTGVLTLTGPATLAQYQEALRSVKYINIAVNPSIDQRVLSFVVNDGSDDSLPFTTNVNIADINELSVVSSLVNTLSYTEGSGPIAINRNITVSDPDGTNIEGAMISITTNFVPAEDTLGFSNQNGISGVYNATTGKLTLTGTATLSQYQTALRNVTYNNPEDLPTTSQRAVSFIVNDGIDDSVAFTTFINIAALLDAPVISGVSSTIYYTENDSPRIINNGITITDPDSTNLQSASVSIIAGRSTDDLLEYIQSISSGVTVSYNSNTGVLSFSGTASISDVETFFNNVVFSNTGDNPSGNRRAISFIANDGTLDSNALISYVNVTSVDDPLERNTDITISNRALNPAESFNIQLDITDLFTDPDDNITLTATKPDGSPLPTWCYFDSDTATFLGIAPSIEESLQIVITASNGRETVSSNVFIFSIIGNSPGSGNESYLEEVLLTVGGAITAGLIGLGFWKFKRLRESNKRWSKYPLADKLRRSLNLDMLNPNSNAKNEGHDFRAMIYYLKEEFKKSKNGYASDIDSMNSDDLDILVIYLSLAIRTYVRIIKSYCAYFRGNKIITKDIQINASKIVEMTMVLRQEEMLYGKEYRKSIIKKSPEKNDNLFNKPMIELTEEKKLEVLEEKDNLFTDSEELIVFFG